MIHKPPPSIIIPIKGMGFINHGSGLVFRHLGLGSLRFEPGSRCMAEQGVDEPFLATSCLKQRRPRLNSKGFRVWNSRP